MEEKRAILGQLTKRIEHKINQSTTHLLEDATVKAHVAQRPELKHVLRMAIARGTIPENGGVQKARELIQQAVHGAEIANKLENRIKRRDGRPPKPAQELQTELKEQAHTHEQASKLMKDTTFRTYLHKMALNLHELGHETQELQRNPSLANAILDHITTEYQLMRQLDVPPSIIKKSGHQFTVFHADQVYRDATRVFGSDKHTKPLVRTAAIQLLTRQYASVEEAKKAYDEHIKDATKIFGGDPESAPLARTAAFQLFLKKYDSIEQAKRTYDKHYKDATRVFGTNEDSKPLIRTAAIQLFTKGYKTIEEAKKAYDKHYKDATRVFGTDEDSKPLVRTAAVQLFVSGYKTIKQAKRAYDKHIKNATRVFGAYENAKPLVRTAAVQLFTRQYDSIEQAKRAYDAHFKDATRVFGGDEDSKPLVRTAAIRLFTKKYSTIEDAKRAYDKHYKDATRVFGRDEDSKPLVRTVAIQLFVKGYKTIQDAKRAYDKRLAVLREQGRRIQLRGLKIPELKGLERNQALTALEPVIDKIADNFKASYLGKEDTRQIAQLAALEVLQTGERNAQAIIDKIIKKVTQEAAAYAFAKATVQLPKER